MHTCIPTESSRTPQIHTFIGEKRLFMVFLNQKVDRVFLIALPDFMISFMNYRTKGLRILKTPLVQYRSSKPSHHYNNNIRGPEHSAAHVFCVLSSLAVLHIHKHNDVNIDNMVLEFACLKGRRLALCLKTLENHCFSASPIQPTSNCPKG